MDELERLKQMLYKELNNFVVKDTYTKGKNAGLRKAIVMIEDIKDGNYDIEKDE